MVKNEFIIDGDKINYMILKYENDVLIKQIVFKDISPSILITPTNKDF